MNLGIRGLAPLLACAAAPAALAAGPTRTLTLEQAVDLALRQNPRLRAARSLTASDGDQARSVRGHLLPMVDVSILYDDASSFENLNLGGLLGPLLGSGQNGSGPKLPPPAPISNMAIGLGTVTVAEPLLGLWHLSHEYASAADHADASQDNLRAQEADLREQVETGFLSLFEARALQGIAKASYDELADQEQLTQAKFRDGVLTRADVLRVKVALANADQQRIQAEVQEQVARASLLTTLGLPPDESDVEFAEPTALASREVPSVLAEAEAFALAHRGEVQSSEAEQSAAHHGFVASELKLLPEINASAMYLDVQGLPAGLPKDYWTVGVTLDWPIWQWGSSYYQARVASERADAAAAALEGTRSQVELEVNQRLAEERAAAHAVLVAQDAIQQAEEAFRVTESMVKAGAATTTDLLDAQSALTQAKLNLVRARYQDLRTRAALTRALGA
ncbi:MAG: TolC family protein [Myxococcales bacterium]